MQNYTKRHKQSGTRDRDFDRNILYALAQGKGRNYNSPSPHLGGGRLRSWTKAGKKGNSRGTSICPRTDASIGEMPGSRQRRLHRSDKFQLSPRQREASQIETKLFPFHGKRKGRGGGRGRGQVSSKSAAASFSRFNPTRLPFYHSSDVVSRSLRLLCRVLTWTTDGIQGSRHVSFEEPVSTIPSGNGGASSLICRRIVSMARENKFCGAAVLSESGFNDNARWREREREEEH